MYYLYDNCRYRYPLLYETCYNQRIIFMYFYVKQRILSPESWVTCVHYNEVIRSAMASQITSLTIVYSIVYSGADQRKHQSSASLAFCGEFTGDRWIPRKKWPVTRKMFPYDDVIILSLHFNLLVHQIHRYCIKSAHSWSIDAYTIIYV